MKKLEVYAKELEKLGTLVHQKRAEAVQQLVADLNIKIDAYYSQDFLSPTVFVNNQQLLNDITNTIEKNLSDTEIPQTAKDLKEHAGHKQTIYNIVAALTWILIPFSAYMLYKKGTFFYFDATNGTEEKLQNTIKPELESILQKPFKP